MPIRLGKYVESNRLPKNEAKTPDAVFHMNNVGKEPMIIIFGNDPKDVLGKIAKII